MVGGGGVGGSQTPSRALSHHTTSSHTKSQTYASFAGLNTSSNSIISSSAGRRRVEASPGVNGRLIAPTPQSVAAARKLVVSQQPQPLSPTPAIFSHSYSWASASKCRVDTKWDKSDLVSKIYGFSSVTRGGENDNDEGDKTLEFREKEWVQIEEALSLTIPIRDDDEEEDNVGKHPMSMMIQSPLWLSLRSLIIVNCQLTPTLLARLPKLPMLELFDASENILLSDLHGLSDNISVHSIAQQLLANAGAGMNTTGAGEGGMSNLSSTAATAMSSSSSSNAVVHNNNNNNNDHVGTVTLNLCWLNFAPRLKRLILRKCNLTTVPSLLGLVIQGNRPALEYFDLSHNLITNPEGLETVAATLTTLILSDNHVTEVRPQGVRLLSCLTRLRELAIHPNPVVQSATSQSAYRAAVIDVLPALATLDGAPTPPSALKHRLAREAVALEEAAKRAAATLRARRITHVYGQGTGLLAASRLHAASAAAAVELVSPPRPPPRQNLTAITRQRASSSKLAQPVKHTDRPTNLVEEDRLVLEQAARTIEVRDRVLAREVAAAAEARAVYSRIVELRRPPPTTSTTFVDNILASSPPSSGTTTSIILAASSPTQILPGPPPSSSSQPISPLEVIVPLVVVAADKELLSRDAWAARQDITALSFLSALKALVKQQPWKVEVTGGTVTEALNSAAQASASATASVLGRLEGLLGESLGECDIATIARRATDEPALILRELLASEVREALLGGRALAQLDWKTVENDENARAAVHEIAEITATARAALRLKAHALILHALAMRRLTQATTLLGIPQTDELALVAARSAQEDARLFIAQELNSSVVAHLCVGMR